MKYDKKPANLRTCVAFILLLVLNLHPLAAQDRTDVAYSGQTPDARSEPDLVKKYQSTITESDLASHLYVFASDFFEGRETATRGQRLAATFLAGQYRKMGIDPKGTAETDDLLAPENYYQPFPLYGRRFKSAALEASSEGEPLSSSIYSAAKHDGKAYLAFGNAMSVSAPVVFGGYAIEDDELGYNDFKAMEEAGIDYKEHWLLVMNDEPLESSEKSLLPTEDGSPSKWTAQDGLKWNHLFGKGLPKGILIVGDVGPNAVDVARRAAENAANSGQAGGQLSLNEQGGGGAFPPFYIISSEFANQILAPTGHTIGELKKEIDQTLTPIAFTVDGVELKSDIAHESYETSSENVAAFIEGSDPELKDEVVVISSHYDHIGIEAGGDGDDVINNGADDDGSGTVAILEIAEAFKTAVDDGYGPRRSILFLNVSGEEKGLLGSAYYSDSEPIIPIENTVTNLNIDMIGRFDPTHPTGSENYVYIIGSNLISQELHDLNAELNELTGIDLELDERYNSKDDPNQFYRRSDHWNFGKHNVPFIFFFTGTHDDYHGVDDEPHKIEYPRMARIAKLIFATAWQVANQDERPAVSGQGFN